MRGQSEQREQGAFCIAPRMHFLRAQVLLPPELVQQGAYSEDVLYMPYSFTAAGYAPHAGYRGTPSSTLHHTRIPAAIIMWDYPPCHRRNLQKIMRDQSECWGGDPLHTVHVSK